MRRPLLLPLTPLYWAAVQAKNLLYDRSGLRIRRLRQPVISVGSLSAGGAGKTPVVLMLADLLARHGIAADVLTRGYGRGSGAIEQVDPAGPAIRFGDEPLEMAQRGLPVFVGADRFAAGTLAELDPASRLHLLDDGFQHRRLARNLDVVLLTLEDARDWLLPAGNLREPLASLARADVVVVRYEEAARLQPIIAANCHAHVWQIRRDLVLPAERPRKPVAFCGIARPQNFLDMLRAAGCLTAGAIRFPDHHVYTAEHFALLLDAARHAGADGFVTTAKDAVKIPPEVRRKLEEIGPLLVAQLRTTLLDEAAAWPTISRACGLDELHQA